MAEQRKPLTRREFVVLYHHTQGELCHGPHSLMRGDCTGLRGDCTGLFGDCSGLRGDCSGLRGECTILSGDCTNLFGDFTDLFGDCSGLSGDFDDCELSETDRNNGVNILELVFACRIRVEVSSVLHRKQSALAAYRSQTQRFDGNPQWPILADVAEGDFLRCFDSSIEIFRRTNHHV